MSSNKIKLKTKRKKYKITLTRKQFQLLKQYSKYTQCSIPSLLKHAMCLYIRQVSRDVASWEQITPSVQHITRIVKKYKQLELFYKSS